MYPKQVDNLNSFRSGERTINTDQCWKTWLHQSSGKVSLQGFGDVRGFPTIRFKGSCSRPEWLGTLLCGFTLCSGCFCLHPVALLVHELNSTTIFWGLTSKSSIGLSEHEDVPMRWHGVVCCANYSFLYISVSMSSILFALWFFDDGWNPGCHSCICSKWREVPNQLPNIQVTFPCLSLLGRELLSCYR